MGRLKSSNKSSKNGAQVVQFRLFRMPGAGRVRTWSRASRHPRRGAVVTAPPSSPRATSRRPSFRGTRCAGAPNGASAALRPRPRRSRNSCLPSRRQGGAVAALPWRFRSLTGGRWASKPLGRRQLRPRAFVKCRCRWAAPRWREALVTASRASPRRPQRRPLASLPGR